jgi:CubicO group peptidase (beta-lactamase class C family)
MVAGLVAAGLVLVSVASGPTADARAHAAGDDPVRDVVATYRERIPELMAQQHVPGLAVALVDADRTLWVQGFGERDDNGEPVTPHTVFSAESMSKLFTATAVMQEVAAGRLDLDAPITTYLPDFTVHSAFERHPERRITLRMLLSHTAGLPHEAPVGNNNDLDPGTFEAHVRSISETWLRFPVGSGYAYSNLGIDLAGHILEQVEGRRFPAAVQHSLLGPLGMTDSTFDRSAIKASADRAVGHVSPYPHPPIEEPMTAAGGLYTSAADLARFLRFQLGDGTLDGRTVLGARWVREMRTIPPPHAGDEAGYGVGVARTRWNRFDQRPVLLDHGGGGFGFLTDLWWAPQLGVGVAVLTNSQDHDLQVDLAVSILGDLVTEPGRYHDRLLALPYHPPVMAAYGSLDLPPDMPALVARAAMTPDGHEATRWAAYTGAYRLPAWGVVSPVGTPDRFSVEDGTAYFRAYDDADTHSMVSHPLVEVEPGLFLADDGETLDLRGDPPTWGSLRLVRVSGGPGAWQWVVLAGVAAVSAGWLGAAAVRARRRRSAVRAMAPHRVAGTVATLTAIVTLGSVALLLVLPDLVDSGFLGGLDLPLAVRVALHLPLALAVLTGCAVLVTGGAWLRGWWPRPVLLQYAALVAASGALTGLLAGWQLIGWGFG